MAKSTAVRTRKTRTNSNGENNVVMVASASPRSVGHAAGVEDEIRTRAYELYEQEGRQDGRDLEYWCRAEAEVLARRAINVN